MISRRSPSRGRRRQLPGKIQRPSAPAGWDRPHLWAVLLLLGLVARSAFVLSWDHPAFDADEAIAFSLARELADPSQAGDLEIGFQALSGIRLWASAFAFWLTGFHPFAPSLVAVVLHAATSALFVLVLYGKVSPRAALGAGLFLAVPPPCAAYFATLLQRHLLMVLFGAIFFLGSRRWFRNSGTAAGFGVLLGWSLQEGLLAVFYAVPAACVAWKYRERRRSMLAASFAAGLFAAASGPLILLHRLPAYDPENFRTGLASLEEILWHLRILLEAFPQFWCGNFPYGNLQESRFAQGLMPAWEGFGAAALAVAFFSTAAAAVLGLRAAHQRGGEGREAAFLFGVPAALFLFFFLFSAQIDDARAVRYLTYLPFAAAAGLGLGLHTLPPRVGRAALAGGVLLATGLYALQAARLPGVHPARTAAERLEKLGVRAGYASSWLSEPVRYLTGGRLLLSSYNAPPVSRRAYFAARRAPRTALVFLPSLDSVTPLPVLFGEIAKAGYGPPKLAASWPDFIVYTFERSESTVEDAVNAK